MHRRRAVRDEEHERDTRAVLVPLDVVHAGLRCCHQVVRPVGCSSANRPRVSTPSPAVTGSPCASPLLTTVQAGGGTGCAADRPGEAGPLG